MALVVAAESPPSNTAIAMAFSVANSNLDEVGVDLASDCWPVLLGGVLRKISGSISGSHARESSDAPIKSAPAPKVDKGDGPDVCHKEIPSILPLLVYWSSEEGNGVWSSSMRGREKWIFFLLLPPVRGGLEGRLQPPKKRNRKMRQVEAETGKS